MYYEVVAIYTHICVLLRNREKQIRLSKSSLFSDVSDTLCNNSIIITNKKLLNDNKKSRTLHLIIIDILYLDKLNKIMTIIDKK